MSEPRRAEPNPGLRGATPADRDRPRLDLRLAAAAGAGWLVCGIALHAPTPFAPAALIAGAAMCLGGLLVAVMVDAGTRSGLLRVGAIIAAAGAGMLIVCAPLVPRLAVARDGAVATLARSGGSVEIDAVVAEDPRVSARPAPAGGARATAILGVRSIRTGAGPWRHAGGQILALGPAEDWIGLAPSQRIVVRGSLSPSSGAGMLSGALFVDGPPRLIGGPRPWFAWSDAVRADLRDASSGLPPGPRGLLPGLVLGDVSRMDPVLAERFRAAGLTHLVAVSGANVAIVVGGLLFVLRRARVPTGWCALLGAAAIVAFVIIARPSPSVIRAAIMAVVAMAGLGLGRTKQAAPLLCAAVLATLVWRPGWALDAGFGMSVAATGALVAISPGWAAWLRRRGAPAGMAEALAVAAAATAATLPLSVAISGRLSLLAVPANVLAAPAVPAATVLGVLAALTSTVWPAGGALLAQAAGVPCRWLVAVAEAIGSPGSAQLPWSRGWLGGALIAAVLVAVGLAVHRGAAAMLVAAMLAGLLVNAPLRHATAPWPPPGWRFVACDIGQGDGLVLRAGPGSAVVIDSGPAAAPMDRCLSDLGVNDVPLLILTHFHADHVGGIAGVFHGRTVRRVVAGPLPDPAAGYRIAIDVLADYGHPASDLGAVERGDVLQAGAVTIEVLWSAPMHGTRSDPNNSSLVLRAAVDGMRIMLPGDSEVEEQQAMLQSGAPLEADVLKVAHHGSAHIDPRWLAATKARTAIISVGAANDYGLPSPKLLSMLSDVSMTVLRTDQLSDIALTIDRGGWATAWRGHSAYSAASRPGAAPGHATAARAPPRPGQHGGKHRAVGARARPRGAEHRLPGS